MLLYRLIFFKFAGAHPEIFKEEVLIKWQIFTASFLQNLITIIDLNRSECYHLITPLTMSAISNIAFTSKTEGFRPPKPSPGCGPANLC